MKQCGKNTVAFPLRQRLCHSVTLYVQYLSCWFPSFVPIPWTLLHFEIPREISANFFQKESVRQVPQCYKFSLL